MAETSDAPLFTIEHCEDVAGTAEEVWAALLDFDAYGEWNPYVTSISGRPAEGQILEVTIRQENWPEALTIHPSVVRAECARLFHWRGRVGDGGLLDTDHSFHIEPLADDRVRFIQREEFRGTLAPQIEADARRFTYDAFLAMNQALARRVELLRSRAGESPSDRA